MENENFKLGKGKIAGERQNFYLDKDGSCKWSYIGLMDTYEESSSKFGIEGLKTGICAVCNKNPLRYNFVLQYNGAEKPYTYAIVGSECIQSLDHVDMLRLQRDRKEIEEKHKKDNAMKFGMYLEKHVLKSHPEIWKMRWTYFGKEMNLGGSVKFLKEKCLSGISYHEKELGKDLKAELLKYGIKIPNMKEIKEILNTPTFEDFKEDEDAIARSERAYENILDAKSSRNFDMDTHASFISTKQNEEISDVPEGYTLKFVYGKYLPTGKTEIMKVELVPNEDPILKALRLLAGDDTDFAQVRNNVGFAKMDVEFGHSLASQDHLSEKQKFYGKKLIRKYHRQIPSDLWKEIFGDEKQ